MTQNSRISIRLPAELKAKFEKVAQETALDISDLIRLALITSDIEQITSSIVNVKKTKHKKLSKQKDK